MSSGIRYVLALPFATITVALPGVAQSTTRDSAGVRIVENTRPAWPAGSGWKVATTPDLDIGTRDDSLYQLATVMGAVRLSDGRIAVANMSTSNIRIYDARGRYLNALGRKGQGPGEFQQVLGIDRLPGDTLAIYDMWMELEYFLPDGTHLRGVQSMRMQDGLAVVWFYPLEDGSFLRSSWPLGNDHAPGRWLDSSVVLRYARSGGKGTIISRFPAQEYTKTATLRSAQSVIFGPMGMLAAAGDGYYVGYPGTYEIRHHHADGRLDLIIRAQWSPKRVSRADIDRYKKFMLNVGGEGLRTVPPRLLAQRKQLLDEAVFARQLPAYSIFMPDAAGNLWVRDSYLETYLMQGFSTVLPMPTSWRVFDREGRWLGTVTMPARFNPMDIGPDYVLGLWRDSDDVEHVRMYRLSKSGTP